MLGVSVLAGMLVAQGDQALAQTARDAARTIARAQLKAGKKLWYTGAWGFQYYMDLEGARKVDWLYSVAGPGDEFMEAYSNNVGRLLLSPPIMVRVENYRLAVPALASTLSEEAGAGFYSNLFGPAPYVFGPSPDEGYFILVLQKRIYLKDRQVYVEAPR
jgi:hypothetical protein